ncbi:hypothetical protein HG536_0F03180 [Torulaspora globosa]|uniref:Increased recombination centers protein 22 n=1 Tax=Torulaspora globosa TaxID=48254 RepID=A0A7G3ZKF7_9SACH|nr:uncharacterized protein HG536_0F03180 [Torulaspora globosa]QLL33993.1 hypothetical protein HG536_0F03180 [Torulaspora globosa]
MRFLSLIFLFIVSRCVAAIDNETDGYADPAEQRDFVNLNVTYDILEKPKINFNVPTEFAADETATFNITFQNNEDSNVTVVGLSGSVIDAMVGYEIANISAQELGPLNVAVNETVTFRAPIQLTLPEGSFFLAPILFIVKADKVMKVGIPPLSIFISPPPLSFLNPSFLSVQVLLGLVVVGTTYLVINFKKQGGRSTKKRSTKARPVDENWLPSIHKK